MTTLRGRPAVALLKDGKVLIAGGVNGSTALSSAEIFDPATRTFKLTSDMTRQRLFHSAVSLANGEILISGGSVNGIGIVQGEVLRQN
jgi:hypothetical protein